MEDTDMENEFLKTGCRIYDRVIHFRLSRGLGETAFVKTNSKFHFNTNLVVMVFYIKYPPYSAAEGLVEYFCKANRQLFYASSHCQASRQILHHRIFHLNNC